MTERKLEQEPCKFRPLLSSRLFYDRQRGKRLGVESALERLLNMPYALGTPVPKTIKQYQRARDLQMREGNQGKQEVLITEDGGGRRVLHETWRG